MAADITENRFFEALDAHSERLRSIAADLSKFLTSIKNPPAEINLLKGDIEKIIKMDIRQLDVVFVELKNSLELLEKKFLQPAFIAQITPGKIVGLMQKERALFREAASIMTKADELLRTNL